jgi:hypothetical protein
MTYLNNGIRRVWFYGASEVPHFNPALKPVGCGKRLLYRSAEELTWMLRSWVVQGRMGGGRIPRCLHSPFGMIGLRSSFAG